MFAATALCLALAPLQDRAEAQQAEGIRSRLTALVEERLIADGGLEYASIAVEYRGRRLGPMAFGDAPGRVGPDAPQPAASASSLLLAGGALVEISKGKLELETALGELLPELGDLAEGRTVRHLLARTSGLPDLPEPAEGAALDAAGLLASLAELAPLSDPDECVRFSSADDLALGLVIERASGQPLKRRLTETLLTPFGLEDPWGQVAADDPQAPPAMVAAFCDLGATDRAETETIDVWGFRGLRLAPSQLLELWSAYSGGAIGGASLSEAAFTPQRVTSHSGAEHGFRVHRTDLGDLGGWLHGGGFDDQWLSVVHYPEVELRLAILGRGSEAELAALGRFAARAVLDWPEPEPVDLPLAAERRAAFLGTYQIGCNTLSVVARGDRVFLERSTGTVALAYRGGDVLTDLEDPYLRLEFELGRDGRALRFVFDDHGQVSIATRVE